MMIIIMDYSYNNVKFVLQFLSPLTGGLVGGRS